MQRAFQKKTNFGKIPYAYKSQVIRIKPGNFCTKSMGAGVRNMQLAFAKCKKWHVFSGRKLIVFSTYPCR